MSSENKQIIYLSYDGLTDPLGQSQILPYVIGLSSKGYNFTVVTFEKSLAYTKQKKEIEILCQQNGITWVPLRYHKNPPVLSTLYDLLVLWNKVSKIFRYNKIAILHCRSYITSIVGLAAKRKWNVKFIFDMRGFWADERVEGGLWNLKNPMFRLIYRYFKNKEKLFLTDADHVISLTHSAKREIESWGLRTAPIEVIPTCVDLELFNLENIKDEDQNNLRVQLGIKKDDFVLLYLGSWGTWYLTEEMLKFFSELKRQKQNAKFLIVSGDTIGLENYAKKNVVVVVSAPRHLVPLYISLATASVFFIKTSFSKKASSATKMAEIMAMNVPVVTNSDWGDINKFSNEVIVLQNTSDEQLKDGVLRLLLEKKVTSNSFKEDLSLPFGIQLYNQVYQSIAH